MAVDARQGLLLMPQISGYEAFVGQTELTHSQHIMAELHGLLVDALHLPLHLSELDGEALLFYGFEEPPAFEALAEQARAWVRGFHGHLHRLKRDIYCDCGVCLNVGSLGLRAIAHHGEFGVHRLGGRTTVVGKEVILARQLADHSVAAAETLLLTRPLMERLGITPEGAGLLAREETFPVFGTLALGVLELAGLKGGVPAPAEREISVGLPGEIHGEVTIAAGLEQVAAMLTDFQSWPRWMEGLSHLETDSSAPLRSGTHHICLMRGRTLHQSIESIVSQNNEFSMISRVVSPQPFLKQMIIAFAATETWGGVRLRQVLSYQPRAGAGWLFRLRREGQYRRWIEASLDNLKQRMEGGPAVQAAQGGGPP